MYQFRRDDFCDAATPMLGSANLRHPSQQQKKEMALAAIRGERVTDIAKRFGVSRKCVYAQKKRALKAISEKFEPKALPSEKVLFTVDFTPALMARLVLAMFLCGRSSYRSIQRIFLDVFGFSISLGKLSSIISTAAQRAEEINQNPPVEKVEVACHDEFYHGNKPYVVAVEPLSRFCFLLETGEEILEDLWRKSLERLVRKGYQPEYIVADGGRSLRSAARDILEGVPCYYDIFHLVRYFGHAVLAFNRDLRFFRENHRIWQDALESARGNKCCKVEEQEAAEKLAAAKHRIEDTEDALKVVKEGIGRILNKTTTLTIERSIQDREASYEKTQLAIEGLAIGQQYPSKSPAIGNLQSMLAGQKENILGLYRADHGAPKIRASSMVENFNYRLRQQTKRFANIDPKIKHLNLFYLNYQRPLVCRNQENRGKSAAELLTGKKLGNWFYLLCS